MPLSQSSGAVPALDFWNAVVLDVGKGIGVGIIADGVGHAGAHAAAGRVAWIPLPMNALSPDQASSLGSRLTGDGLVAAYRDREAATR